MLHNKTKYKLLYTSIGFNFCRLTWHLLLFCCKRSFAGNALSARGSLIFLCLVCCCSLYIFVALTLAAKTIISKPVHSLRSGLKRWSTNAVQRGPQHKVGALYWKFLSSRVSYSDTVNQTRKHACCLNCQFFCFLCITYAKHCTFISAFLMHYF